MPKCKPSFLPPILLSLLPWPMTWLGLFVLKSMWATFALYHGLCLVGWLAIGRNLPRPHPSPWRRRHWLNTSGACLIICLATYFIAGIFPMLLEPERLRAALKAVHATNDVKESLTLFLYFATVNPVIEEMFWRGTIYERLRISGIKPLMGAALSGFFFGAWHFVPLYRLITVGPTLFFVFGIMCAGVLLAVIYERSRSLHAGMLVHALGADIPVLIALWVDVLRGHS